MKIQNIQTRAGDLEGGGGGGIFKIYLQDHPPDTIRQMTVPYKRVYKSRYLSMNMIPHRHLVLYTGNTFREETRLLGRPQPQMYPPVALNQYTWVNRTPKHLFIYALRPHEKLEIDFTPKLSSQQHVKYGSNLMKICY